MFPFRVFSPSFLFFLATFSAAYAFEPVDAPVIYDMHIHARGGMNAEKAAIRQIQSGVRSGVLENYGREWPLHDSDTLRNHIGDVDTLRGRGVELFVGIQVNDRDWFETIDPAMRQRLDYILADTMIMGTDREGRPCRLWMEDRYEIPDVDAWMERYMAHNLQILAEPIDILANPTYLPPRIASQYDRLWTPQRMDKIIDAAVKNGIALEIQAESPFPKTEFLKRAKAKGAVFSFGTNNFDDKLKDCSRWYEVLKELELTQADLYHPVRKTPPPVFVRP
ncbi:MAG TPA: hypothetical protein DEB39_09150 [Planctomycetaceae bacterium]|nr:hypothetical protein [Planctomycetaceae bacterium]